MVRPLGDGGRGQCTGHHTYMPRACPRGPTGRQPAGPGGPGRGCAAPIMSGLGGPLAIMGIHYVTARSSWFRWAAPRPRSCPPPPPSLQHRPLAGAEPWASSMASSMPPARVAWRQQPSGSAAPFPRRLALAGRLPRRGHLGRVIIRPLIINLADAAEGTGGGLGVSAGLSRSAPPRPTAGVARYAGSGGSGWTP